MTVNGWFQILFFLATVALVTPRLGAYMARVFTGQLTPVGRVMRPIERLTYRLAGVDEAYEMRWTEYAASLLLFSTVSLLVLYLLQRVQGWLPLNPQGLAGVPPDLAFNTAVSFTTNTNWQAYAGETTMSYLTQMAGLAYQNFVSAAAGLAVAIAVIRGIARRERDTIGSFWVDLTRATLYVLLPIAVIAALVLVSQGVVQNLRPYETVQTLDGTMQVIAQGPVASQEAIKMFGTNGGGFFNANSAHPFENPTPFTNWLEMFAIFAIPSALTYTLGSMTGSRRHGWAVWGAMAALFLAGVTVAYWSEARGNPLLTAAGADQMVSSLSPGGNMEGKEVRFGIANTALFATATTAASCGAINGWHDSFTPLGGLVPLANIQLGEVVFGGVGAGLYGMVLYVILAVFVAGLMVGRTPEYLGKRIQAFEVQMAMLTVLIFSVVILAFSAASSVGPRGTGTIFNPGPHGLSELVYADSSATANNGSAFGGLGVNTPWFNTTLGLAMLFGRFFMMIPPLAMAGSLARKKLVPPSAGTFPVTTPLFSALLVGIVVIVGALTFFPSLSLGPIVEHFLMQQGQVF